MNSNKNIWLLAAVMLSVSSVAYAQTYPVPQQQVVTTVPQVVTQAPALVMSTPPAGAQPICRPYTDVLTIGDDKRITEGTACLQADGTSWALQPSAPAHMEKPDICCPASSPR